MIVEATPTASRLPYGVLVSFPPTPSPDPHVWLDGVDLYDPVTCVLPLEYLELACPPASGNAPKSDFLDAFTTVRHFDPVTYERGFHCSSFPLDTDLEGKARQVIEGGLEYLVSSELERIALETSPLTVLATSCPLAELVENLAAFPGDAGGFILAPYNAVTSWLEGNLLAKQDGRLWASAAEGSIEVVPGTGLVGTDAYGFPGYLPVIHVSEVKILDQYDNEIRLANNSYARAEVQIVVYVNPCEVFQASVECGP